MAWTPNHAFADQLVSRRSQSRDNALQLFGNVTGGVASNYGQYGYYDHRRDAEVYDPVAGTWSPTGSMSGPRAFHTATLLGNGKVLVVGGCSYGRIYNSLLSAELYDPATGIWTSSGSMSTTRYKQHTATLLANGQVLVAGGYDDWTGTLSTAELYNPATGTWAITGSMSRTRNFHTATLLGNGRVLVTLNDSAVHGSVTGNTSPYLLVSTATLSATSDPGYLFIG